MLYERILQLSQLLEKKSHFLFGPRGTGKTSLIKSTLSEKVVFIDLLSDEIFLRLLRNPSDLENLIAASTSNKKLVVIDEIQKIPPLLDEVHRLIENKKIRFLLTGSSARKLRRGAANLLGGRAWEAKLFPLTWQELGQDFNLKHYLNSGGLPEIYSSAYMRDELKNYIKLYLKEEIQAEALVRRLDHFVRFLDIAALSNGEELNFEAIGNDAGVPSRTVATFFEVLEDTLIGFQLPPYLQTKKRKAIKRAKFYFFDVGVAGALAKRGDINVGSELFGKAFEHFIIQEARACLSYLNLDLGLNYWRSTSQQEVDLIIGNEVAIKIKSTSRTSRQHLSGLIAFSEEKKVRKYVLVSQDPLPQKTQGIDIMPWKDFLKKMWGREFF